MDESLKDYEVGYGKPPTETRFVKGQSGNPRGRPKGTKNAATIFHEVTREQIQVTENGKRRTIQKVQAIWLQLTNKAVSGDLRAMKEILQWNRVYEEPAEEQLMDSPDAERNEAVMKALVKRINALRSAETPSAAQTAGEQTQ